MAGLSIIDIARAPANQDRHSAHFILLPCRAARLFACTLRRLQSNEAYQLHRTFCGATKERSSQ
jgi:hypothetical protein